MSGFKALCSQLGLFTNTILNTQQWQLITTTWRCCFWGFSSWNICWQVASQYWSQVYSFLAIIWQLTNCISDFIGEHKILFRCRLWQVFTDTIHNDMTQWVVSLQDSSRPSMPLWPQPQHASPGLCDGCTIPRGIHSACIIAPMFHVLANCISSATHVILFTHNLLLHCSTRWNIAPVVDYYVHGGHIFQSPSNGYIITSSNVNWLMQVYVPQSLDIWLQCNTTIRHQMWRHGAIMQIGIV